MTKLERAKEGSLNKWVEVMLMELAGEIDIDFRLEMHDPCSFCREYGDSNDECRGCPLCPDICDGCMFGNSLYSRIQLSLKGKGNSLPLIEEMICAIENARE